VVGRRPFSGNNIAAIFRAITQDEPEAPDRADPFVPKALSDVILKSLAKSPDMRFQTGKAFSEALAVIQPLLKDGGAAVPAPQANAKKGRPLAALGGILLALLVAGGGYYLAGHKAPVPSNSTDTTPNGSTPSRTSGPAAPTPSENTSVAVEQATLQIESDPAGANVFVDNNLKGITPIDVALPLGKYEVRLSMEGYLEWEAQVELDAADVTPLHIPLRALD